MARHLINSPDLIDDAVNKLLKEPRYSVDTETFNPRVDDGYSALYPYHGARAFAVIFATEKDEYYFDFNRGGIDRELIKRLSPLFVSSEVLVYWVNAAYDMSILAMDGIEFNCRIVDCPTIARIEYNQHGKDKYAKETFLSMAYLAEYYGVQQKNDIVKEYIKDNNLYSETRCVFKGERIPLYNLVPLEIMLPYGCDDARTTFDLAIKIIKCINYKDQQYVPQRTGGKLIDVVKNEIALTSEIHAAKFGGLRIWPEYIEKAIKHETKKEKMLALEIDSITGGINLNSGPQVAKYLVANGVEVPRKEPTDTMLAQANKLERSIPEIQAKPRMRPETKEKRIAEAIEKYTQKRKGNYICDADTLEILSEKYDLPFLTKITDAKRCTKKVNSYYKNFSLYADDDNILHADINPMTAKTGRFSIVNPALQTIYKEKYLGDPNEFLVRKAIIANEPDELLLFADYKQQEMIVMLDQAEEMEVIRKLLSGEYKDFYLATAATIKEKTKKEYERWMAKKVALSLTYGEGKDALARGLKCTVPEAMETKKSFFTALPKLQELDRKLKRDVKIYGKIHNPFGRVSYIGKGKEYTALNSYIQGTSADITKTAIILCGIAFRKHGFKSRFSLCVHDELIFRVKENELEKITPIIESCMVSAYTHKHIPLEVDFEISRRNASGYSAWGEKVGM